MELSARAVISWQLLEDICREMESGVGITEFSELHPWFQKSFRAHVNQQRALVLLVCL